MLVLLVWLTLVTALSESPASSFGTADGIVIASGHVDIGPRLVDGRWTLQVRDDTVEPAEWRTLEGVALQVVDAARLRLPAGDAFSFLAPGGTEVWLLPQVEQQGLLWPGWNTQDPSIASVRGPVIWQLESVKGPGAFALFLTGSFGQTTQLFSSLKPLPQEIPVEMGTHAHGNWAFSAPGVYRLSIKMTATSSSGEQLSDRGTLLFAVGPVDPRTAFVTGSASERGRVLAGIGAGVVVVAAIGAGHYLWRKRKRV